MKRNLFNARVGAWAIAALLASALHLPLASAQDDNDGAAAPKKPPTAGATRTGCWKMEDGTAKPLVASFKADHPVGFGDAVDAYRPSRARCDDATTAAEMAKLKDVNKLAPHARKGKASPALQAMANKALARMGRSYSRWWGSGLDATEETTLVSAVALDTRKKLVNGAGVSLGTTQRVSMIMRVNGTDTCLELRGEWRKSTLQEDQDNPEYVVLDRMRGGAMGWRNMAGFDFMDLVPAWLVACPAGKR